MQCVYHPLVGDEDGPVAAAFHARDVDVIRVQLHLQAHPHCFHQIQNHLKSLSNHACSSSPPLGCTHLPQFQDQVSHLEEGMRTRKIYSEDRLKE